MKLKTAVMTVCAAVSLVIFPCGMSGAEELSYDEHLSQFDFDWGVMACQSGDYQSAVKLFEQAIRKNPDFAEAYFRLGYTYGAMGKTEAAMTAYRTLKTLNSAMADKLSVMLVNLRTLGKFQMSVGKRGTATGRFSEYIE